MYFARLLAGFAICVVPAAGQARTPMTPKSDSVTTAHVATHPELLESVPQASRSASIPVERSQASHSEHWLTPEGLERADSAPNFLTGRPSVPGTLSYDSVCFSMRSYKVAKDSKDSDAVHPVGYTTCQPGRRFGLKTTDLRSKSAVERETVQ